MLAFFFTFEVRDVGQASETEMVRCLIVELVVVLYGGFELVAMLVRILVLNLNCNYCSLLFSQENVFLNRKLLKLQDLEML